MSMLNRMGTAKNPHQRDRKRVLCVCSAGVLRSPTMAYVLSQEPWGFNTRAAGCSEEYALIQVDDALVYWADEIICVEEDHRKVLLDAHTELCKDKPIHVVKIKDEFPFRDPYLVELITHAMTKLYT